MASLTRFIFLIPTLLAVANTQGIILSAQGTKGSPASLALQVNTANAADANVIKVSEVAANIVNECGRTLLAGNIDIGSNTEDQLANKTVTSVTKGGSVAVTIKQVSADGAGPYSCDMDFTSNASGTSGQVNVTSTEKAAVNGNIALTLIMPANMACIGASPGNICTVRCVNAKSFGGCFAVQQTDTTASVNNANTIATAQTLEGIDAQIAENKIDLPAAIKANQQATTGTEQEQGLLGANALLALSGEETTLPAAIAATSTSSSKAAKATKAAKGTKANTTKNGNKGNGNAVTASNGNANNRGSGQGRNNNNNNNKRERQFVA